LNLKIYPVVLELVRRLSPVLPALRKRSWALAEQLERALISVPLNVAEGAYSRGKNRQARYQTAAASAREVLACLGRQRRSVTCRHSTPISRRCFIASSVR
jgi:four helix bundle protein